ncbi:MAG: anion permease [Tissierellales bacterium]|nr:anion permease [Tissierellales bacterium]MBN2826643.1 anion permease [Tissierellales bacterium]
MRKTLKTLILPFFILLLRPFEMNCNQSFVMAALILTIIWWTTGIVNKLYSSVFLLIMFIIFGQTPILRIFNFPLSETFVMIVFSYIFSQGISNSKLAHRLLETYLYKYGSNFIKLMILILILQFLSIFVIPQAFSRIIILSIIIKEYFEGIRLDEKSQSVLMFWLYSSSIFINMTMIKGDLILNNALLNISNIEIAEFTWIKYMAVPTLIFYFIAALCFVLIFNKDLRIYNECDRKLTSAKKALTRKDQINIIIISFTVILWATESLHGQSGTLIVIIGSVLMFFNKLLKIEDLKCVDINLLVFLTAAFSIGKVMTYSGTSDLIFSNFVSAFPNAFDTLYIFMIIIVSMSLHMILGSNLTTLSVVLPGVLLISKGVVDPILIVFIVYIAVCAHYILPFHSVIILIGNGNKLFSSNTIIKFGPSLTVIVAFGILYIYRIWWMLIGVF